MESFGDFEEGSRAVPNDVDFDEEKFRLVSEVTDDGSKLRSTLNEAGAGSLTACIFNGSASQSLAEAYLAKAGTEAVLLSRTFLDENQKDNDEGLSLTEHNPKRRLALSVYKVADLILFVVDQEQFGSVFSHQLVEQEVRPWIEAAKLVYIFHADSVSNFKSNFHPESLYYVKSSALDARELPAGLVKPLPQPNLVEHFSAAVLIHCEVINKPCLLLTNYIEFSDTLSHVPFIHFIQARAGLKPLLKFSSDIALRTKSSNAVLYNSNLFI